MAACHSSIHFLFQDALRTTKETEAHDACIATQLIIITPIDDCRTADTPLHYDCGTVGAVFKLDIFWAGYSAI